MKIRVLSDLHLEYEPPGVLPDAPADLVVLAGDIDNHARGLAWAAGAFDPRTPVVYVPGNHEYYDGEYRALERAMHDAAHGSVHFLNNAALVDPAGRWRVLGTTLWADFALYGASDAARADALAAALKTMLDFRGAIRFDRAAAEEDGAPDAAAHRSRTAHAQPAPDGAAQPTRPLRHTSGALAGIPAFTPADSLALHAHALRWLEAQLAQPFAGRTIVVTHHAPHRLSLAARYADDLASAGFVSHLDALVRAPVALWIHGHTHTSFDYTVNGTRVVCNPRGYRDRRTGLPENPAFAWDRIVEI